MLAGSDVEVDKTQLRSIIHRARSENKPGVYIARKLMMLLFTVEEMALSRGQGIGKTNVKDDLRPPLDSKKINALKGKF